VLAMKSSAWSSAFAVVALACAAPAAAADDVKVWSEAVAGSDIPMAVAEAVLDAPAAVLWDIVSDCNNFKQTMPNILNSQEISRSATGAVCQVTADLPFPLPDLTSKTTAVHTIEPNKSYLRRWNLIEGDYTINEGSWKLEAVDATHTKVTYRLRVRPKMPVPDSMLATFQSSTMPKLMRNLQKVAASRIKP
jgi:ribosome-associated toxin RatA of RatAB toxin-antitoxin module